MDKSPAKSNLLNLVEPDIELAKRMFDELFTKTADGPGVTRASYGEGENIAHHILRREGERLKLHIETDAASNLYLTLSGETPNRKIIIGSHLDSVPLGGNFDGAAGVLCGLSVIAGFVSADLVPPRYITLMAIRAEESTWYEASYIGSRAAFGQLSSNELDQLKRSSDGMNLGVAISAAGGNLASLRAGKPHLGAHGIALYLEAHIEQGPSLVIENAPLAVVSGIRGAVRYRSAVCKGTYAHSGAMPRAARCDTVRATAALVMAMESVWDNAERNNDDMVVTFGKLSTDPAEHAFSKVAGRVDFALEIRSQSPKVLHNAVGKLISLVEQISRQYSVCFDLGPRTDSRPAAMEKSVQAAMQSAISSLGLPVLTIPCGAGHDAAVFAEMGVPTGMLLIRNENGSHNPDEAMEIADFAAAAQVLTRICQAPPL